MQTIANSLHSGAKILSMKLTFSFVLSLILLNASAQLLSWTPQFAGDAATVEITMDANLGNQGLLGHTASDVFVHTGVITNLSATPSSWRYVKFNQNFTLPNNDLRATPVPNQANRWTFTIPNIRAYYGVPAGEQIQKIAILFRSGNGSRVQRNSDGSDMYIPIVVNPAQLQLRITNPFSEPRFNPVPVGICQNVGENVTISAVTNRNADIRIIYNGDIIANQSNVSTASITRSITAAGPQQFIIEAYENNINAVFTFTGSGSWNSAANWQGGQVPPTTVPSGTEIRINPAGSNAAVLDVSSVNLTFSPGSKFTIEPGKNLEIIGNLDVKPVGTPPVVVRDTISFFVASATEVAPLPAGVEANGATYHDGGRAATLVLYAPNKNNIVVIGDFNDWNPTLLHQMKRTPDGLRYWVRIDGLTPGEEYAYQYRIDCNLTVADFNSEKILDPWNDPQIPASTYPNLKPYPVGKTTDIVSVLQPGKPQYVWTNNSFVRPDKRNIMCYELLIRDYAQPANFQTIIDSLPVLASLGFNALKLMPFTEFENNNSWGYNPSFMFAVDKFYGTENKLRELIDSCHGRGIAVILDMVLNHQFGQSPMVRMYWDAVNNKPATNSPWFNPDARHPFNVGFDMNHEAPATIEFVERVMHHWLTKFRLDGFRWDLSKGFTQRNTPNDVGAWNAFDQSRVNIWQRIYDQSQAIAPGAYMILEHLGNDDEEAELARRGMLLWGKMTNEFNEASMAFLPNSNFSRAYHTTRWTAFGGNNTPHLLAYAESHDEERLMYKNRRFGNQRIPPAFPIYNSRDTTEAARRMQQVAGFLFTIPGPKMLWMHGEFGYDASINMCENFTTPNNDNCRTAIKPPVTAMPSPFFTETVPPSGFTFQNYKRGSARNSIRNVYERMLRLRTRNPDYLPTFVTNDVSFNLGGAFKWQTISSTSLRMVVVGNFDMVQQTGSVNFPVTGTWHVYAHNVTGSFSAINGNLNASTMQVNNTSQGFTLTPGTFLVLTDRAIVLPFAIEGFSAALEPNKVNIDVAIDGKDHVAYYELERSFNGLQFEVIDQKYNDRKPGKQKVTFEDYDRGVVYGNKPVYYRVRVTDINGDDLYTATQIVHGASALPQP